jgi:hypothetical protein
MSITTDFTTVSDADAAYYGTSDTSGDTTNEEGAPGNGDPADDSAMWGPLTTVDTDWIGGWTLAYQVSTSDDTRRYMVFRINPENDDFEALSMEGNARAYPDDVSLSEIPSGVSEDEARRAYQLWAERNGETPEDPGESVGWGEWTRLQEVSPWWIWGRESDDGERAQFLAASTLQDGSAVYLQPDGMMEPEPYIFDTADGFNAALDAYFQRVEDGEIPPVEQPTGNSPQLEQITEDAALIGADGAGDPALSGIGGKAALALGAAAVGYIIIKKGQQ